MPNTLPIDISPQLIGTPANGVNLYQVPNASMKVLEAIINTTWTEAQTAKTDFSTKIAALSSGGGLLNGVAVPGDITANVVTPTTPTAPTITIADAPASTIYSDFASEYAPLATWLEAKFTAFKSAYFPNDQATYNAAESWIQGALANPNGGIPLAVQSQVMADDQSRVLADATRAIDAQTQAFAAKRFPLPPGALNGATLQIQQKAQDLIGESSRKVAILSVEQMKFAVEKAIALRTNALSAALDYMKIEASSPETVSRLVGIGYDAQSKMISAAASFYQARIGAAELANKVAQFNVTSKLDADVKNQAVDMGMVDAKIKALIAEAQSIAQMATSLFNNLHASVSMQAGGSTVTTQAQSDIA